jgi:hypothetical protein
MSITHSHRNTTASVLAGLFATTVLVLAASPAHATRIPADPIAFVPTPMAVAHIVNEGHASSIRAALHDLGSDRAGQ